MKIGIVINTRLKSSRIPNKAITMINGMPIIEHLVKRLEETGLPIIVAMPHEDFFGYNFLSSYKSVTLHRSFHSEDPLARMNEVAQSYEFDYVIRITHDKIFIDTKLLSELIYKYFIHGKRPEYLYLENSIPGTGFEIISADSLKRAADRFKNVEFIGYAIRQVTNSIICEKVCDNTRGIRLLIDYPQDLSLMHVLLSQLGNDCSLDEIVSYLIINYDIKLVNRLPKITIYTCAYNAEKTIQRTIDSVIKQTGFPIEYIIIDDFSTDRTPEIIARACTMYPNLMRFIRNDKNLGLSSSCNRALSEARGEYILRMDADDCFINNNSLHGLVYYAQNKGWEITYPNYLEVWENGDSFEVEGSLNNHAGGALFLRSAINYVKFTDGLRGHDSLDIFLRSQQLLKIGYYNNPTFKYFQLPNSLSRRNQKEREQIKNQLEASHA